MKMVILSVRDIKAAIFMRPFFAQSTGTGLRSFSDEVNRKEEGNMLNLHPEDFALYEIGVFDDDKGTILPAVIPRLLLQAAQAVVRPDVTKN
ncbi:MAG: nonstructural protein [Microvirus sp.]|nr:MAG: nonstructural protein [Microvirus sp.]